MVRFTSAGKSVLVTWPTENTSAAQQATEKSSRWLRYIKGPLRDALRSSGEGSGFSEVKLGSNVKQTRPDITPHSDMQRNAACGGTNAITAPAVAVPTMKAICVTIFNVAS